MGSSANEVVVADVAEDLQLVARSPQEMKAAQQSLSAWCAAKIGIVEKDASELRECVAIAQQACMKTGPLERQARFAESRAAFYRKVQAAVDAGYCIVPNFPVDIIAIRTTRDSPQRNFGDFPGNVATARTDRPPLGEGRYVEPHVGAVVATEYTEKDASGRERTIRRFRTGADFDEEVEFPIAIARPQVMSATAEAMALKCFDEIGVLGVPVRRGRGRATGDPIVVGRIHDPRKPSSRFAEPRVITFLLAWYIDTAEL